MYRIECGDPDERLAVGQRKALHGRDPDAHSGERSRPRRDREQLHICDAKTMRVQQTHEIAWQSHAMCHSGITGVKRQRGAVTRERNAALPGSRVESKHQHVKFNSTCLPRRPQGTPRTSRRRCGSISTRNSNIATRFCFSAWGTSTRCSMRTRWSQPAPSI